MRRIDINNGDLNNEKRRSPIWGFFWRYLLFLALLFGFLLLLRWLLGLPDNDRDNEVRDTEYYDNMDDEKLNREIIEVPYEWGDKDIIDPRIYDDNPELRDIIDEPLPGEGGNFRNPIPELPDPEHNRIRETDPRDIITPPDDPYKQIDGSRIDVILDDISESNFNNFARQLKQLYPGNDVVIDYYNPEAGLIQIRVNPSERENVKENIRSHITDIDYKIFDDTLFNQSASSGSGYNDPAFKNERKSWHFAPIQAYDAWDITKGSDDIVVAVIDSYIDITHPELKGRIVKPYSVERKSRNVLPPSGPYSFNKEEDAPIFHGTHVAALAVGALNNNSGAAGLAPECKLMPISLGKNMSSLSILEGILYAINQGADVINLSIGTLFPEGTDRTPLNEQLEYIRKVGRYNEDVWDYVFDLADKKNCTIVWAAGNCNVLSGMDETKRGENTIRVSAVGPDLKKASFSNFGNYQSQGLNYSDVSAPGVDIYSAGPANAYGFCPGTSMAAPIVSGAVALMKSVNPNLTNREIIEILDRTGKPVDPNGHIGKLIQVRDALKMAEAGIANYDEIKNDPNSIKGLWKTTEERQVIDTATQEPTGEMTHVYLKFNSINSGTIYYKTDGGCTYSAPFRSELRNDELVISQQGDATSPTCNRPFAKVVIRCTRGEGGKLKCRSYYNGKGGDSYYLIRCNESI
ncbi:MAG: S8 family serine peptidase [Muribaculaceae bacterium]|nr:S8 family serine peptidase [Muribaculaceae bacterium]